LLYLLFLGYIFAVIFMDSCLDTRIYLAANDPGADKAKDLSRFYGTLRGTIGTLMQSVTGGMDWGETSQHLPWFARDWLFPFFVLWTTLGIFNIITGTFVESTSSRIREDEDQILQECAERQLRKFAHLEGDLHRINKESMMEAIASEPLLEQKLDLSATDIEKVFVLFDDDGDGEIDVEEFLPLIPVVMGRGRRLEQELMLRLACEQLMQADNVRSGSKPMAARRPSFFRSMERSMSDGHTMSDRPSGPARWAAPRACKVGDTGEA